MRGVTGYRVLLSADSVGGIWRYAIELARELAALDVEIVLAILGPAPSAEQQREAAGIAGLTLAVTGLALDWTADSPKALAAASDGLAALAARWCADLVHLHAPALIGKADWPAPVLTTVHSCLATWWRAVRGGALPEDFAWRVAAAHEGLIRADGVAAPTHAFAWAVRDAYQLSRPVAVIRNGRRALPVVAVARRRAVLTAGRLWDQGKNVAALDRAAAALDVPVFAAGPTAGPNGANVFLGHLTRLGALDDNALAHHYAAASVFASPARYEPFGLAVLEAAQAGMALVLSDIPGFRELWDGAAIFVDPEDDAALVAALRRALDDAERLGGLARRHARHYRAARMAAETMALHRTLLPALAAAD